mgnify:CR=1 FL=1
MNNKKRKISLDHFYNESNTFDNYSSLINSETQNDNYINAINKDPRKYKYIANDKCIHKVHSNHYSREKIPKFSPYKIDYPIKTLNNSNNKNIYKTNNNTFSNNIKEFILWDKKLSDLSINKYRKIKKGKNNGNVRDEKDEYLTIPNDDIDSYRNGFLMKARNSNNSINQNFNKTNEFCANENYDNNIDNSSFNIKKIKVKNNNKLKSRIRLNKEINNYNKLEKKINKKIEDSIKNQFMKTYDKDYYNYKNTMNNNIYEHKKRNIMNKFLLKHIHINDSNSNQKSKRIDGSDDDINQVGKNMKRNTTFDYYNNKENKENINYNFIKYLKKDNQKLIQMNTIYKQLIDTFFYFIHQLSKKYCFKKEIKDVKYYLSNSNYLSDMLIDLEQHLNKLVKPNDIIKNDKANSHKNNDNININEDDNDNDHEEELLTETKFISMNLDKFKKIEKPIEQKRNVNIGKEYFSPNSKNVFSSTNIRNKTFQNNSLNFINNIDGKDFLKINNKINKNRKNNDRLLKILNKLNSGGLLSSKNKSLNKNKIVFGKNSLCNNIINKENLNINLKSNDIKSIVNPKSINERNYDY